MVRVTKRVCFHFLVLGLPGAHRAPTQLNGTILIVAKILPGVSRFLFKRDQLRSMKDKSMNGYARSKMIALTLLIASLLASCNRQESKPNFSRRVDKRHHYSVQIQEIQIGSTDDSGLPVGNFNSQVGKLPITLSPGKILRLTGRFLVEDGGIAPLSVVVMICPRGKSSLRESLATSTANNVFEPAYPSPQSHFDLDIRLPKNSINGHADIILYAMAGSWSTIKLLATIQCEMKEQADNLVDDLRETHVVSFD